MMHPSAWPINNAKAVIPDMPTTRLRRFHTTACRGLNAGSGHYGRFHNHPRSGFEPADCLQPGDVFQRDTASKFVRYATSDFIAEFASWASHLVPGVGLRRGRSAIRPSSGTV